MNDGIFKVDGRLLAWHIIGSAVVVWIVGTTIRVAVGLPSSVIDLASLLTYLTYIGIQLVKILEKE